MIKNVIILVLFITNICSMYYIYRHFEPEKKVTINTKTEIQRPDYFYSVKLRNGGELEATDFFDKGKVVDFVDKNRITVTLRKADILKVEKVYYSTRLNKTTTTQKTTTKQYN